MSQARRVAQDASFLRPTGTTKYAMIDSTIVRAISIEPAAKKRRRRPGEGCSKRQIEHQDPNLGRSLEQSNLLLPDPAKSMSLMGDNDIEDAEIAAMDDVLQSTLWKRRLNRRSDEAKAVLKAGLVWSLPTRPYPE